METKEFNGNQFYVDDITRELSKKYNIQSYKGFFNSIGESNTESVVGKFISLAKLCGEFVGMDLETYRKEHPGEQWFDCVDFLVYDEKDLEGYAQFAEREAIHAPVLRTEQVDGKKVYFPTEDLIRFMIRGTGYIKDYAIGIPTDENSVKIIRNPERN